MPHLFLNRTEGRLRSFWRVIIQWGTYLAFSLVGQIVIGIFVGILAVAGGVDITDPQAIMGLLASSPWIYPIASILSLIGMLIGLWIGTKLDHRKFSDFGFHLSKTWWKDLGFGMLLGAVLMAFIFAVELAAGWITVTGNFTEVPAEIFWLGIVAALVQFICVGIYEEMLSRGYQIRNLAEGFRGRLLNPKMALLVSYLVTSSIFGFLHAGNPNATLTSSILLIAAGLLLGLGYIFTGELAIPIGLHITWNFFQGNVFGFPVSGTAAGSSFMTIQQAGPDLWTGGPFGPESGLIGLVAIGLGVLMIFGWLKFTRKSIALQQELSVFQPPIHTGQVEQSSPIPDDHTAITTD